MSVNADELKPLIFKTFHRAKFSEIDPYGIMNNLYYQKYFFDHRFDGLREFAHLDMKAISKLPVYFVTKSCKINYFQSIILDEEFCITSQIVSWSKKGCYVKCIMEINGRTVSDCEIDFVCVSAKTKSPVVWPEDVKSIFFNTKVEM